ncbi:HAD-IIIA family hydrolase [uncultured Cardiobacterium sp.]|uniref:D-glycero-alpha-D-manno-heptose-1,7-bisphosphate 7-phosphatase n=1 Tax=uncultured Cardiobacterium sp. TaxID=417619 RepID=UPI00260B44CB|nr:HAD-IIIA family hydrolase [uncultured Cardiobacterium sp.]
MNKKLVLFDRDGVLNEAGRITRPEELRLLSNALRGIARLTRAGIRVGICTNQGGIACGALNEVALARIHDKLRLVAREFGGNIGRIVYCASADNSHPLRKPNPGMLLDQARHFGLADLSGVPFVGDNLVDVQAAQAAGAVPVLVRTGHGRNTAHKHRAALGGVLSYPDVETAVNHWLKEAA